MRFPHVATAAVLGLCASSAAGCGPSYQSVYEGDLRFEHCYRLDDDPGVAPQRKLGCWADWTRHHTYGQTRDRVEYALARERALRGAIAGPGGRGAPPPPNGTRAPVASPMPTSAFVAPPPTLPADAGAPLALAHGAPATANGGPAPAPPGANCAGACTATWARCGGDCTSTACKAGCDESYRGCMRGCF